MVALSKEDFVAAEHYARDMPSLVQRATVFDQMLRALEKRKDISRALEILTEAEKAFEKADDGMDKTRAMLIIAGAAVRIDPLRGFDILSSAIADINRAQLDNKSHRAAAPSDLNSETLDLDQVFAMLARVDFDRRAGYGHGGHRASIGLLAALDARDGRREINVHYQFHV
jgi:hypothetical protein